MKTPPLSVILFCTSLAGCASVEELGQQVQASAIKALREPSTSQAKSADSSLPDAAACSRLGKHSAADLVARNKAPSEEGIVQGVCSVEHKNLHGEYVRVETARLLSKNGCTRVKGDWDCTVRVVLKRYFDGPNTLGYTHPRSERLEPKTQKYRLTWDEVDSKWRVVTS